MSNQDNNQGAWTSKTAIAAYAAIITGATMGLTGYAIPPDAAQLIATGLVGLFLRVSKKE